jgi:hypothetical protein
VDLAELPLQIFNDWTNLTLEVSPVKLPEFLRLFLTYNFEVKSS